MVAFLNIDLVWNFPEALNALSEVIASYVNREKPDSLLATNPIVGTFGVVPIASVVASKSRKPLHIWREVKIATEEVLPPLRKGERVLMLHDVCALGKSISKAGKKAKEAGCHIDKALTIVDRKVGGEENLREEHIFLDRLFTLEEIIKGCMSDKTTSAQSE